MKRLIVPMISLLVLVAGCQTEAPATGETAKKLAASCTGYGFKPGTQEHAMCVYQLDQQRIAGNRNRRMAVGMAMAGMGAGMQRNAAMMSANRPVNCTSTPNSTWVGGPASSVSTTCY